MDPPPVPDIGLGEDLNNPTTTQPRSQSFSQKSDDSHTAADFINNQLKLEADAREALPYSIDDCTRPLGPLRQILFACLTCNPPPTRPSDPYTSAGVCYSCSIQCHGEHTLVELFNKRNFTCDCGTTHLPTTSPCTLRIDSKTNTKGGVHSELPDPNNKYNHNFKNRFCGCQCDYDAYAEKGTMFQCLGLGTAEDGGCGEDWWHPGCIAGVGPNWYENASQKGIPGKSKSEGLLGSIIEVAETVVNDPSGDSNQEPQESATIDSSKRSETAAPQREAAVEDPPLPPGFPNEDDFEGFICYKCVEANPWIKRYASAPGFLGPVFRRSGAPSPEIGVVGKIELLVDSHLSNAKKRKAESDSFGQTKRMKDDSTDGNDNRLSVDATDGTGIPSSGNPPGIQSATGEPLEVKTTCKVKSLPPAPSGQLSLFFKSGFRDHLCRCPDCFPNLSKHPQLLEEEETYELALSQSGDDGGGSTVGSGSLYDRGESALKNVDRVKAIEGVMAYNHLKDKLKPFFQQFADSGQAISAEDIKAYFAKLRGDEEAIKEAGEAAKDGDNRREQSGY